MQGWIAVSFKAKIEDEFLIRWVRISLSKNIQCPLMEICKTEISVNFVRGSMIACNVPKDIY